MKAISAAALLLALVSSSASGDEKKLQEWLDAGSWSQGVEYCSQSLVAEVARRPDLRNVSTDHLSRLAVYCAALASGKGEEPIAGWWWYTAASIDLKTAQGLLPEMRKRGVLQALPPPRSLRHSLREPDREKKKVLLPSGETVPGTPPLPRTKPKIPDYMLRHVTGVAGWKVGVEVVVSREGVPQQPLLVDPQALPIHVLYAYHFLSTWRFEPAKVDGEPVESIYTLTVVGRSE